MSLVSEVGRRFARVATDAAVRRPASWRFFRGLIRFQFDRLAHIWDDMRDPEAFAPFEAALASLPKGPKRVLDLGTGTGAAALALARRFPDAEVVGVDVSDKMLAQAREKLSDELAGRIEFVRADASALPYADESFDLVTHANMIPFFDELARVLRRGGHAVFAFSAGAQTPIYVSTDRLRQELEDRGFGEVRELTAGRGSAVVARKIGGS